jgi:hypothetical protein
MNYVLFLGNYTAIGVTKENKHYYSPWKELIPESRTCQNSYIPENYCVCDNRKKLNLSEQTVLSASLALVDHINSLVPLNLCHSLSLETTIEAEVDH